MIKRSVFVCVLGCVSVLGGGGEENVAAQLNVVYTSFNKRF